MITNHFPHISHFYAQETPPYAGHIDRGVFLPVAQVTNPPPLGRFFDDNLRSALRTQDLREDGGDCGLRTAAGGGVPENLISGNPLEGVLEIF